MRQIKKRASGLFNIRFDKRQPLDLVGKAARWTWTSITRLV